MSLLDIAQKIKETGYNPKTDKVNGTGQIPEGKYLVMLKSTDFNVSESGWERLSYAFQVKEGQFKDRTEFVSFGTLPEWKGKDISWSLERTIKFFQKVMFFSNEDTLKKDYEDGLAMKQALDRKSVGQLFYLIITDYKRDEKVYRNYELEEYEESLNVEFNEDDLPF